MYEYHITVNGEQHLLSVSRTVMPASAVIDSAGYSPRRRSLFRASDDPSDPSADPLTSVDFEATDPSERNYLVVSDHYEPGTDRDRR